MMTRVQDACRQIDTILSEIETKVQPLPRAWLSWRPVADVWSILDILSHIEEFVPYWSGQILSIIHHPNQEWGRTHADPDRLEAVTDTDSRALSDVLASIRNRVESMRNRLLPLSDQMLETTARSRNPRWETKPASFILDHLLVQHVANHSAQIQRNIDQLISQTRENR
ncbi:DinB family protein [Terriglobus albidus]|uniref:DinB family protein n=1 Tax=Terriglobus albidus TaxID=1592106 RepID=A0A5B9EA82_9BACT|nr:DinB family protein [Terriglobus albidus]QEE27560.1 DinB family protein [Terriglobus albidus]